MTRQGCEGGVMALLHTISSVVRLPLRTVGKVVSATTSLLPGHKGAATPPPTDAAPVPAPAPAPATRKTPVVKPPSKGPVAPTTKASTTKAPSAAKLAEPATKGPTPDPAAPAAPVKKTAPAKKAAAKKAPAQKPAEKPAEKPAAKPAEKPAATLPPPVVEPEPAPVTSIDADAADEVVTVTPADVAGAMGSDLDEQPPSSS